MLIKKKKFVVLTALIGFLGLWVMRSMSNNDPSLPKAYDLFNIIPIIKLNYIIPSDPKSGFKSIEGLNPVDNSLIFKLEFLPSEKSERIRTFVFKSQSGILLLRSKIKDNNLNFQFDVLGENLLSVKDKKIANGQKDVFEVFFENQKMAEIIFVRNEGKFHIMPETFKNSFAQISSFLKKLQNSSFGRHLKEFAWAHSFMPENDATPLAIFVSPFVGIVSAPGYSRSQSLTNNATTDSPLVEYVYCLEASCDDCGGVWGTTLGMVGCATFGHLSTICYAIQAILCAKTFLQL